VAIAGAKLVWLACSRVHELHGSWQLLTTVFQNHLTVRFILPLAGIALLPIAQREPVSVAVLLLVLAGEFTGRYLFFVTVVPTNMAKEYLAQEAA
jgi:DMSO reductase anchor subunit